MAVMLPNDGKIMIIMPIKKHNLTKWTVFWKS